MSESKAGRKRQGRVIKVRDLPDNPIRRYLGLVARDNNLLDKNQRPNYSAAGRLVLTDARADYRFLSPASMQELNQEQG